MNYIYHGLPEQMMGTKLIPLNEMRKTYPELQTKYLEKYSGREEILERRIPLIDCLWNDVVQFLPFHPRQIFELQEKMGFIPEVPQYQFFKINLDLLNPDKSVVFFKNAPGEANTEVRWLKDVDFNAIQEIPSATIAYYKLVLGSGELPFNYQFVPHILHMGSVDISSAPIISL